MKNISKTLLISSFMFAFTALSQKKSTKFLYTELDDYRNSFIFNFYDLDVSTENVKSIINWKYFWYSTYYTGDTLDVYKKNKNIIFEFNDFYEKKSVDYTFKLKKVKTIDTRNLKVEQKYFLFNLALDTAYLNTIDFDTISNSLMESIEDLHAELSEKQAVKAISDTSTYLYILSNINSKNKKTYYIKTKKLISKVQIKYSRKGIHYLRKRKYNVDEEKLEVIEHILGNMQYSGLCHIINLNELR